MRKQEVARRLLIIPLSLALVIFADIFIVPQVSMFRAKSLRERIVPGMSWNEVARELERSRWYDLDFTGSKACGAIVRNPSGSLSLFHGSPARGIPVLTIPIAGLSDSIVLDQVRSCPALVVRFVFSLHDVTFKVGWDVNGKVTDVGEPRKE